jgi:lysophospholipase L1-like esterase
MNWETLLSFGDSITFGARSYLGYPDICGDLLGKKLVKHWHVINHSANGYTTMDLSRSIDPMLDNYKKCHPSIITVMIGTNDVKENISLDNFTIAYRQLIVKLRLMSVNNNIILFKIPQFTHGVFYPYNFSMNDRIVEFNIRIGELAKDNRLRTYEFEFDESVFFDGVHLNEKGCHTAAMQLTGLILQDKGLESTSNLS